MPLSPGEQLGHYKILSMIGKGGMGEVYLGTDTRLDRPVAIKVSSREFNDRFEREAQRHLHAQSSQHLHALRCRPELPGDGIHRGRDALEDHRAGSAAAG